MSATWHRGTAKQGRPMGRPRALLAAPFSTSRKLPPPLVFLMAGEPSGDAIGARLMAALRREYGAPLHFAGVGGARMAAAGLKPLFPMDDLSVMGFSELVPALPRLVLRFRQTLAAARAAAPDLVVGIDSKAFCLRVLGALAADRKQLSDGNAAPPATPALVQYVAPSAWAFADAPRRAGRLSGVVDELLVLLPFEPALFEAAGTRCTFVGHPALEEDADETRTPATSDVESGGARGALCLLPGSRRHEVDSNLPIMLDAAERIAHALAQRDRHDGRSQLPAHSIDRLLLPAPPSVRALVEAHVRSRPPGSLRAVVTSEVSRHAAYRASSLALACCGTVNTELARAGTPQVAMYRSNVLTSLIVRRLLRPAIQHAALPNIMNVRRSEAVAEDAATCSDVLIPEVLFEECTAQAVAHAGIELLTDPDRAERQLATAARSLESLAVRDAHGAAVPSSTIAARALLQHLPRPS